MRALAAAMLVAFATWAQAAEPLPAPDDWRREQFTFPLPFAPSIPFEGTEYVRFSPAWARFAEEDGFTYIVLWDLKARAFEPQDFERGLAVYFDGLMENVSRARKAGDPGVGTVIALHPAAAVPGWDTTYGGRVWTLNAFSKAEPLALHMEISHRRCAGDRTQVLMAFSRAERSRPAWLALRGIRDKVSCAG
jgi:hypothetical protein